MLSGVPVLHEVERFSLVFDERVCSMLRNTAAETAGKAPIGLLLDIGCIECREKDRKNSRCKDPLSALHHDPSKPREMFSARSWRCCGGEVVSSVFRETESRPYRIRIYKSRDNLHRHSQACNAALGE